MSNTNNSLLNARVRLYTGTISHITKINANGYGIAAAGPQVSVKRIVVAGKMLKELPPEPLAKGTFVIVKGVTVVLNKRQQSQLAEGTLNSDTLIPNFSSLSRIDPETGKIVTGDVYFANAIAAKSGKKEPKQPSAVIAAAAHSDSAADRRAAIAALTEVFNRPRTLKKVATLKRVFKIETILQSRRQATQLVKLLGAAEVMKRIARLDKKTHTPAAADQSVDTIEVRKTPKNSLRDRLTATIEQATTKSRRRLLSEAFNMDWADIKRHGADGIIKHAGTKSAARTLDRQSTQEGDAAFIKSMPTELKRLMQEGQIVLNKAQITRLLESFGLDTRFYDLAIQNFLGNLRITLDRPVIEGEVVRKSESQTPAQKVLTKAPVVFSAADVKKRMRKLDVKLIAPSKKKLGDVTHSAELAKASIAHALNIDVQNVVRGLRVYNPAGDDLMYLACDATGVIFADKTGHATMFPYSMLSQSFNLTLTPTSELDAKV